MSLGLRVVPCCATEDVFGPINSFYFSIKLEEGMQAWGPTLGQLLFEAGSFKKGKKFFIDTMCPGRWPSIHL